MTSIAGIVSLLLFFGLIAGFWVGLSGLRRAGCGTAWWIMTIGLGFCTFGPLVIGVGLVRSFRSLKSSLASSATPPPPGSLPPDLDTLAPTLLAGGAILIVVGLLLFAAGYAIHAMRIVRMHQRSKELEEIAMAMGEELNRFRNRSPTP